MSEESDTHDGGEPTGEAGPSNPPDGDLPSEQDVQENLPGVPEEAEDDLDPDEPKPGPV
jgi:hypothetical protein